MLRAAPWIAMALLGWTAILILNRRSIRRHENTCDPAQGILVFVEPVRWLFIIWGFGTFCGGLRSAGWKGQARLFRWSTTAGALLVFPDVVRQHRLLKRATELSNLLHSLAALHPGATLHVCGYSSGCYVAIEAVRSQWRAHIATALLLAATISPDYDFQWLSDRTTRVHHAYSPIDMINLLGPLLIGTNDRRWTPSCGVVGFRSSHPRLHQRRWRLCDIRQLYFGDHFTVVSPRFIRARLAPAIAPEAIP